MRTLTVLDCTGVGPGGISRVLTEIVRNWPGDQQLAIVSAPRGWTVPAESVAETRVYSHQSGGRAGTIASGTRVLRRLTAGTTPENGPAQVLSLSPSVAVAASRLPVTTIVHDLAFKLWPHGLSRQVRRYRAVSYSVAIRSSQRLLCVSARTRHDLFGHYGIGDDRALVWEPGSDLAAGSGTPPDSLAGQHFLVVPGHASHKGVELAVEALPSLPGYTLAVLTSGQGTGGLDGLADRLGVRDRVQFLPRLDDADYAATLKAAAAFIMPSHFEGYGLPAAEAQRLGTATIISPDPALQEATRGRAIRMVNWTAGALATAVREAEQATGVAPDPGGRSWRAATDELFALLHAGHMVRT